MPQFLTYTSEDVDCELLNSLCYLFCLNKSSVSPIRCSIKNLPLLEGRTRGESCWTDTRFCRQTCKKTWQRSRCTLPAQNILFYSRTLRMWFSFWPLLTCTGIAMGKYNRSGFFITTSCCSRVSPEGEEKFR